MRKILKHPIVSAVVASLLVSGLSWVSGYIPTFSAWQETLTRRLPVPIWLFVFLVLLFVFAFVFLLLKSREVSYNIITPNSSVNEDLLSEGEVLALKIHVGLKEGYGIVPSDVANQLNLHIEEARLIVRTLQDKRYTSFAFYVKDEAATVLTDKGRRYVVEHGLLD